MILVNEKEGLIIRIKKKLLVVSPYLPYDNVGHAGGKTHNYYLKRFHQSEEFDIKLITFANLDELKTYDLDKYGIDYKIIVLSRGFTARAMRFFWREVASLNLFDKKGASVVPFYQVPSYPKVIIQNLRQLKKENYYPDIILMEWTQTILLIDEIKKIYPNAYYISSEHDVSFLTIERGLKFKKGVKKFFHKIHCKHEKRYELYSLGLSNLVVPHNVKDKNLLINEGINPKKIHYICPYYSGMFNVKPDYTSKNIIFFGAMDRSENYLSAIWFIENVFGEIVKGYPESKFFVVGGDPPGKLLKYKSDNTIITGFIDNPKKYFEKSSLMVAPLLLGGGIKVKILEGMSAELPIVTNNIGIEGIPAREGTEYLHAETPEEYIICIKRIFENPKFAEKIGKSARKLVEEKFNLNDSFKKYKEGILEDIKKGEKLPKRC